jgi:hypothetical protein
MGALDTDSWPVQHNVSSSATRDSSWHLWKRVLIGLDTGTGYALAEWWQMTDVFVAVLDFVSDLNVPKLKRRVILSTQKAACIAVLGGPWVIEPRGVVERLLCTI